ncbi:MAG: hypothetical protein U0987_15620, partial [Afipia sp.]|nr:hypothetical protein [Afipia sp.]
MIAGTRSGVAAILFSLCSLAAIVPASALELEQARERCRASIGKPTYMACRQTGGQHDGCMARAKAAATPCVRNAMMAARPKAALFDATKVSAPTKEDIAAGAAALAKGNAVLVAPPRTVSDITAILDQQKPDPAKIAELTATADAPVPAGLKGNELAAFHYKRGQARTLVGRSAEALQDAEQTVALGKGEDVKIFARYEQFLMRRLREAGENKRADAIAAKQIASANSQPKGKGRLFGLYLGQASGLIRSGDVNAAESYAARNRSLLAEAQRWPVFPIYGMSWQAIVEDGNARVAEARGRFADAEAAYRKSSVFYTKALASMSQWESKPAEGEMER